MNETAPARCGFVALLGAPNAGKSTLLNRFVGAKVSIVTPKVQTTRRRILGIALRGAAQIVFIDTPGIFQPKKRFDRAMVRAAWSGARDADLIVVLIDATEGITGNARRIIDGLSERKRKAICAINKIDAVARPGLLTLTESLDRTGSFSEIFMIIIEMKFIRIVFNQISNLYRQTTIKTVKRIREHTSIFCDYITNSRTPPVLFKKACNHSFPSPLGY